MDMRRFGIGMFAVMGMATGVGCSKSGLDQGAPRDSTIAVHSADAVARGHWMGKKHLNSDANAADLMGIWKLPESEKLQSQMLDKISLSPWRLYKGDAATNEAPTILLRPLLDDLVNEEAYFEVRSQTNQSAEIAIAIRLSSDRAALWETNLAIVLESLTGKRVTKENGGWLLEKHDAPNFGFARESEWIVVGLAQKSNTLVSDFKGRIRQNGTPVGAPNAQPTTNYWLTLDLDLARSAEAVGLDWQPLGNLSRISISVGGDGSNVHTRGELDFSKPTGLDLEPWNIPTNLVRDPLISFTAVRGLKTWLAPAKWWTDLWNDIPPDQFFFWSQQGVPLRTYLATPTGNASNQVNQLTQRLLYAGNSWLATNGMGEFRRIPNTNGVAWSGAPFMSPYMQSISSPEGSFVYGGLIPDMEANGRPPLEMLQQVWGRTNLVLYQWELTGPKIGALVFVGQAFRVVLHEPQLPFDSTSMAWLKSVGPKLGNCGTVVTMTSPTQFAFVRKSSIGLTALELHAVADWLESPVFPLGFHTLDAPSPSRIPTESNAPNAPTHP